MWSQNLQQHSQKKPWEIAPFCFPQKSRTSWSTLRTKCVTREDGCCCAARQRDHQRLTNTTGEMNTSAGTLLITKHHKEADCIGVITFTSAPKNQILFMQDTYGSICFSLLMQQPSIICSTAWVSTKHQRWWEQWQWIKAVIMQAGKPKRWTAE